MNKKYLVFVGILFFSGCVNNNSGDGDDNSVSKLLHIKDTAYVAKISNKYYHSTNTEIKNQFSIGSITKVFTATLIFNLEQKNKLSLNDKVSKYISNFKFNKEITIKELLSHTSGIREYEDKFMLEAYLHQKNHYSYDEVLNFAYQTNNKKFAYVNANYIILGKIIKNITGKPFEEYVHEIIIDPLGLQNTCIAYEDSKCNPTPGYINAKQYESMAVNKYVRMQSYISTNDMAGSAGNLISNIYDLDTFLKALVDNKFFDFSKMITTSTETAYKYGIMLLGGTQYGHSGGTLETSTFVAIDTSTKNTTIILLGESSLKYTDFYNFFMGQQ